MFRRVRDAVNLLISQKPRDKNFSFVVQKYWRDSAEITVDVLDELYTRNGLARNVIDLLSGRVFNKWNVLDTEDQKLKEAYDALSKKEPFKLQQTLKEAWTLKWRHGYCLLVFNYVDSADSPAEPVTNPVDIKSVAVLNRRAIKKFVYEKPLLKAGAITGVVLDKDEIGSEEDVTLDASRFLIIGSIDDKGKIFTAYNYLDVFDNVVWSLGQSFFRYASGFPVLKIADASDDELEDAEKQWINVTARTGFVGTERHSVEFVGANGRALPAKEYFEAALKAVAIAFGVPYALLEGAHAGTISGSETNSDELNQKVEAFQKTEVEPVLHEIITRLFVAGRFPKSDVSFRWVPLRSLDEKEQAEIERLEASADAERLRSGVLSVNEVRRRRGYRNLPPDNDYDVPLGDEYNIYQPLLSASSGDSLRVSRLESAEMERHVKESVRKLSGLYDFSKLKKVVAELSSRRGDANEDEFLNALEEAFSGRDEDIKKAASFLVGGAWSYGYTTSQELLNKAVELSTTAKFVKAGLESDVFNLVKGLDADIKQDLRTLLFSELAKAEGSNLEAVKEALSERLDFLKESLPRSRLAAIARTESNRALTAVSKETYKEAGVRKWEWLTAGDDRVRPEHQIDGEVVEIGKPFSNGFTQTPAGVNCRCDLIPVVED